METPAPAVTPPLLLTTTDIADRIAKSRNKCNPVTVWRALRRLKILPTQTPGRTQIKLYTLEDAIAVEKALRAPNKKKPTTLILPTSLPE